MQKRTVAAALLVASCGTQAASDADLAAIRAQIADLNQHYEQRIATLEQKLAQAEAQGGAERPAIAPAEAQPAPVAAASAFNPEASLILQGQYRNMKNIPARRIGGFFPAGEISNDRGFSVDESELGLAANIDPYWRGQAIDRKSTRL